MFIDWQRSRLASILSALEDGKNVLVTGVRGSGKSTCVASVTSDARIDLDDPRFAPQPSVKTLDVLLRAARRGESPLVLDEIDRVSGWREWLGKVHKTGARFVATHSGTLDPGNLPGELHHERFLPLGFHEVSRELTDKSVNYEKDSRALHGYLRHGGFLDVVGVDDPEPVLLGIFERILYQDVVRRQEFREIGKLTAVAVNLLKNTAGDVSASGLKGLVSRSVDQARASLQALHRSGLVFLVPRIEDVARPRVASARRCYACDPGLACALAGRSLEPDRLAETAVFLDLLRRGESVVAWRFRGRSGPAVLAGGKPGLLVDVGWGGGEADHRALAAAMSHYRCGRGLLLDPSPRSSERKVRAGYIQMRHLPAWLLGRDAPENAPGRQQATPEEDEPSLPVHLL